MLYKNEISAITKDVVYLRVLYVGTDDVLLKVKRVEGRG